MMIDTSMTDTAFARECADEIAAQGADAALRAASAAWLVAAGRAKYSYHFQAFGVPIIQYPQDIVVLQELIWRIRPRLIIETGIARGGSLIMSAGMLAVLDVCDAAASGQLLDPARPARRVVGIDIDIRPRNRAAITAHPLSSRIDMIEGSSIDADVVARVRAIAGGLAADAPVLVILDSNHTHDHVLAELEAYAPLVTPDSYCAVLDTVIEDMPDGFYPDRPWDKANNPKSAVRAFLARHPEFEIDPAIPHKLLVTAAPDGFLRRK
jgi:cephalosporin hydroxylase